MKYKVGDEVRIRADLKKGDGVSNLATTVSEMIRYAGKTTTIRHAYNDYYKLDIDNGCWAWTDDMFESDDTPQIEEPKKMRVKDFFENFIDYGGSVIRIVADNGNFDTRIGYNYIDKEHCMWRNFIAMYGNYLITEWSVNNKEDIYKVITVYVKSV